MLALKVKQLDERAQMPVYKTTGAACMDLSAVLDRPTIIRPGELLVIRTGLAFAVPEGYVMQVFVRSSVGFKHGVCLANGTGIIDSDYRGEVMVALINKGQHVMPINPGDRIAQAMLVAIPAVVPIWSDDLSHTERGAGGIGSTGVS